MHAVMILFISFSVVLNHLGIKTKQSVDHSIKNSCINLSDSQLRSSAINLKSLIVEKKDGLPEYCKITGTILPSIGFEARYPIANWNKKYFQAGCGGFCGVVLPDKKTRSNSINHALKKGYATITADSGHQSPHIGDASWAKNNLEAQEIYAHENLPLTYNFGQYLVNVIYNQNTTFSYFSGCSNGGRMGAIAAQRYPELFDGIISGCPIVNLSMNGGVFGAWVLQSMTRKDGSLKINHEFTSKLRLLEDNALYECDYIDGNKDGIIAEPENCKLTLEKINSCSQTDTADCLTPEELSVVKKWYKGPTDNKGRQLFPGMPPGSERYWGYWYLGTNKSPGPGTLLADGYGKYLAYPTINDDFNALTFDFSHDVNTLNERGEIYNALDPNLEKFKKSGGKMIMWHGSADPLVIPKQSMNYYISVVDKMGSYQKVDSFFRLYMAPGLGHCWEKPANAPDTLNMLEALENWVELNKAPDVIVATQYDENEIAVRTAQLRPYPLKPTY
jgi:feruloyl esterase